MITKVIVLGYEAILKELRENRLPPNAIFVSITDPEEEPVFDEETDRIITFAFHDVDPVWFKDYKPGQGKQYRWMTEDEAKKCADFIFRHHAAAEECVLYTNCMAGICRSGAVGTFAHRVAGIPYADFRAENRTLFPNGHILRLLMREWYKQQWAELDAAPTMEKNPEWSGHFCRVKECWRDSVRVEDCNFCNREKLEFIVSRHPDRLRK